MSHRVLSVWVPDVRMAAGKTLRAWGRRGECRATLKEALARGWYYCPSCPHVEWHPPIIKPRA